MDRVAQEGGVSTTSDSKSEEAGLADQLLFICSDMRVVVFLELGGGGSFISSGRKEKHLGGEW